MEDIEGYLTKLNVKDEEKRAILASDSSMKEILGNPLFAMMCASSFSITKLSELQSQQRLYTIFESFMKNYKEVSKKKPYYTEKAYNESFDAVCKYAAYQLGMKFEDYHPDYEVITKFGLVKCMKSKLSLSEVKTTYSFFHQTFLEYFAARWIAIHNINDIDIYLFSTLSLFSLVDQSGNISSIKEEILWY